MTFSCISTKNQKLGLEIIYKKSWFNDFEVIDDKVLIKCTITIKNNTGNNIEYRINAIFNDDVRIELLRNETLEGYKEDLVTNVFTISSNETIEYEKIVFIGEFAENNQKHDRNLPKKINIILLE
jgi:hypothetical protein